MDWIIYFSIFFVAFLYSSVGHGGASGYLAIMVIFNLEPSLLKSSALILNLFVSGVAFFQFYRSGYFRWKVFLPFAIGSIPMAFVGSKININTEIYHYILAVCLLFATLRILISWKDQKPEHNKKLPAIFAILIGCLLGFVSGMIGIGGGIILSPLLLLFHWTNLKETAAVSALFIFVNSLSALGGVSGHILFSTNIYFWIAAAIFGGSAGAYFGVHKFNHNILKFILAFVLIFASIKLFIF